MESFIIVFSGLGLFFIGVKLIGGNLKQMVGRRFRATVARAVAHPVAAAALGVVSGALTQSTNAITFISINTVTAGLVRPRDIIPVMIWANVGTSALVLLATLDIHLLVLFLVGCVGFLFYLELDKSTRYRHVVGALLGVGLLFLGIDFIHAGAGGLKQMPELKATLDFASNSYALAFVIGVVVTVIAQSSATVTVVAVAMVKAGLLGIDQTIFIVYGAGVGSGIGVWLMTLKMSGTPRQLAAMQIATKFVGAIVLVPLFMIELWTGWPLVKALAALTSPALDTRPAWIYLFYQIVSVIVMMLAFNPILAMVGRLYPETLEENLSKPRFIHTGGEIESATGALLAEKEQQRLVGYLRDSLDGIREDTTSVVTPKAGLLHRAGQSVGAETEAFLTELMETAPQRETMEQLTRLYAAQGLLNELSGEVYKLVSYLASTRPSWTGSLAPAVNGMIESLHLIVVVLGEELDTPDEFQRATLAAMTSDRSDMMDRLRRELTGGDTILTRSERETLFTATTHFEHVVWLTRRYITLIRSIGTHNGTAG